MRMIGKKTYQEAANMCVLPSPHQHIVKVVAAKGNNRYEVRDAQDRSYLVTMPGKFRKTMWIFPGHYVLVNPLQETGRSVRGEIAHILLPEHIDYIHQHSLWPAEFRPTRREVKDRNTDYLDDILLPTSDWEDDEDVADLMYNYNKVFITDHNNDTRPSLDDYDGDDDEDDDDETKSSDDGDNGDDGDDDGDDDKTESSDNSRDGDDDDNDTKPSDSGLDSDNVDDDDTNRSYDDNGGNDDDTNSSHGYCDEDDNDHTSPPSDNDYDGDEEEELQH